jgi:hypothetical protein
MLSQPREEIETFVRRRNAKKSPDFSALNRDGEI